MTEQISLTPTSDAISTSQDALADAILALGDTPERRAIIKAYRDEMAAIANALQSGQGTIVELMVERFDRLDQRAQQRDAQIGHMDRNIELIIDRFHTLANKVKARLR